MFDHYPCQVHLTPRHSRGRAGWCPWLLPLGTKDLAEGHHVFTGLQHEDGSPGEALRQGAGQVVPAGLVLSGLLLGEHRAQRGGDHALVGYAFGEGFANGDALQQVPGAINPAALAAAALQHPPYCIGETAVGIADHELDLVRRAVSCNQGSTKRVETPAT